MSDFVTKMAYTGETPWHGKGGILSPGASIEVWRKEAGLDFVVERAPAYFRIGADEQSVGLFHRVNRKDVLYRNDTQHPLGIVDKSYKTVQPDDILEVFRRIVGPDMQIETAGSLKGGAVIWALAKLSRPIRVGKDISFPYFLLTTSYNGEMATIGTFTIIRVVCWNTLSYAYSLWEETEEGESEERKIFGFTVGHRSEFDPKVAADRVQNLLRAADQYEQTANELASAGVNDEQALAYFASLVGVKNKNDNDLTRQSRAKIDRLLTLYRSGPGAELAAGTRWGLLNAVTRYVDHEAVERSDGGRLASAWYGNGKTLKSRAFEAVLQPELVAVAA